jgi:hypothetical protein
LERGEVEVKTSASKVDWRWAPVAIAIALVLGSALAATARANLLSAKLEDCQRRRLESEQRLTRLELRLTYVSLSRALNQASRTRGTRSLPRSNLVESPGCSFEDLGILPGPPLPSIDGVLVATKDDVNPGLVLLSVGSQAGVEAGFCFSVYRDQTFLGKVVVERIGEDWAGCRVLFLVEGERLQAGDLAATRLP